MSASLPVEVPHYTYEDYCQWEGRWELIQGMPYAMVPAPIKIHQQLSLQIGSALLSELSDCLHCEVLLDEDWKVSSDMVLNPDVTVVYDDSNPNYINKTPDVIFEILSPSTAKRDETLKFSVYEEEGVQYYVLAYPDELLAKVYQLEDGQYVKAAECDTEAFSFDETSCAFTLDFMAIFKRFR